MIALQLFAIGPIEVAMPDDLAVPYDIDGGIVQAAIIPGIKDDTETAADAAFGAIGIAETRFSAGNVTGEIKAEAVGTGANGRVSDLGFESGGYSIDCNTRSINPVQEGGARPHQSARVMHGCIRG